MYDIFKGKRSMSITKYGNNRIFLLLITIFCIILFIFLIIKSIQMKNNVEKNIETISNKKQNIFVKEVNENITVDNIDIDFYDLINNNKKNLKEIVINNKYLNEFENLDDKINELFDLDILENKQDDNIQVSENIKNVYLNKKNEENMDNNNIKIIKSGIKVQLGAMKTNEFAEEYKNGLISKYNDLFKNLDVFIEKVDLMEKGVFYRVRFGIFKTKSEAKNFCNKYIKISNNKLSSCIVIDI